MSAVASPSSEQSPSLLTSALRGLLALFLWATMPAYRRRWTLLPVLTGVSMMAMLLSKRV